MEMHERSGLDILSEREPAGGTGTTALDDEAADMGEGILSNRRGPPSLAEKRVCEEIREQDSSGDEDSPVKQKREPASKQKKKIDVAKLREKIEHVQKAPNFEELSAAARNAKIILGPKLSREATEAEETLKN